MISHVSDTVYTLKFSRWIYFRGSMLQLKTAKISFNNPHTSTSPITGDKHVAIHMEASNTAIRSMRFHDDRACDSSLLRACQLGLEIRKIKTPRKFCFQVFGANLRNIVPAKILMYTVMSAVVAGMCGHQH